MEEKQSYTLQEAELHFAKSINGTVWELLDKTDRTALDDERMLDASYASCYHWMQIGTGLEHERGEWLIARVYTVVAMKAEALRHASRCLELTQQYAHLMQDFDHAFAFEGVARANALAGSYEAGEVIAEAEDRSIFMAEFNGGSWHVLE